MRTLACARTHIHGKVWGSFLLINREKQTKKRVGIILLVADYFVTQRRKGTVLVSTSFIESDSSMKWPSLQHFYCCCTWTVKFQNQGSYTCCCTHHERYSYKLPANQTKFMTHVYSAKSLSKYRLSLTFEYLCFHSCYESKTACKSKNTDTHSRMCMN